MKAGVSLKGVQRYRCQNPDCTTVTLMKTDCYKAYESGVKEHVVDRAINGSGIRDTSHVLKMSKNTVIATLKKRPIMPSLFIQNFKRVTQKAHLPSGWSKPAKKLN